MAGNPEEKLASEPKLTPSERHERTNVAFRKIVDQQKRPEKEKTARLREATLKRGAEQAES